MEAVPLVNTKKKLRSGYTTGSCAAAAAKAATSMLLSGVIVNKVSLLTPKGVTLQLTIEDINMSKDSVRCAIRKDSGDDPDVTNGILVYAKVNRIQGNQTIVDGGIGVGRVTLPGLWQKIGEAAINKVPRQMIMQEVTTVCEQMGYDGGLRVIIEIPEGVEIAKRTFNPRLGIEGGISVLGTTGIVEPMSESALIDSIALEIKVKKANGQEILILTPGNYGADFLNETLHIDINKAVKCSNYVGEALDTAVEVGYMKILMVGHVGKFVKLAAGIMNTHSKQADARMEIFLANAALEGANLETLQAIEQAITTDEMISILKQSGHLDSVMKRIMNRIQFYVQHRLGMDIKVGIMVFSVEYGLLGQTEGTEDLIIEEIGDNRVTS
ncbi:cobalt-precorrin 5B C1-methyltransferase [Anaerosporobacter mobilis DSM 15930]|jgi:cobalt-precorrin-5B (C1)-methyltransferase|uniref:Cobalt-precorrin-5B C(1)-methyltransferase n=1 Tax=Anaerosporobacter mobilis DSM 15930 TaxID=1120996 RepID=A0A1M7G3I7_9FIRM|nr:cobalt-precorrin-5B (C(1))-methyltransferase CbiD [Anaerosporobacter mobilis]SHM10934.1 cobalt-precorrin 5B C1-methyltransferase [Anaerosporobacter mobilis DSM 15930]